MSTHSLGRSKADPADHVEGIPMLRNGDRLTADEFERRYDAMPELKKAELIEGVVYVGSPVSENHGAPHFDVITWLGLYRLATPGIIGSDNGTVRLDDENRPQPDVQLRLKTEYGGQTHISDDDYVVGAPELIVEIAASSVSYDLHDKMRAYQRNRVLEYIIWRVQDDRIDWFALDQGQYRPLEPGPDGVMRSQVFPGLWLDPIAMIAGDLARVGAVLRQGLASPEHAAFVARLQAQGVARE